MRPCPDGVVARYVVLLRGPEPYHDPWSSNVSGGGSRAVFTSSSETVLWDGCFSAGPALHSTNRPVRGNPLGSTCRKGEMFIAHEALRQPVHLSAKNGCATSELSSRARLLEKTTCSTLRLSCSRDKLAKQQVVVQAAASIAQGSSVCRTYSVAIEGRPEAAYNWANSTDVPQHRIRQSPCLPQRVIGQLPLPWKLTFSSHPFRLSSHSMILGRQVR